MGKDNIIVTGSLSAIANSLAMLFYGKELSECIGHAQNLNCGTFQKPSCLKVTVEIPRGKWIQPVADRHERNDSYYIESMIAHARKNGYHVVTKGIVPFVSRYARPSEC
jgi:hypothetical protein